MANKVVVAASGGMDSTTLAWGYATVEWDVVMVGFDYGQRHRRELEFMNKSSTRLADLGYQVQAKIVRLDGLTEHLHGSALTSDEVEVPDGHYAEENMRATVVPNRNAIMLSIAAGIAVAEEARVVATAVHAGDHFIYPDCRPEFIRLLGEAFQVGNEGFAVEGFVLAAPFSGWSKADIARRGDEIGVDWTLTWSCYKGGDIHCGKCGTCVERIEAFQLAGVEDPTEYADPDYALQVIEAKA